MKGTIKIDVVDTGKINMEVKGRFNQIDRLFLIDSLVTALIPDKQERWALGSIITGGGLKEVMGEGPKTMTMPLDFYNILKRRNNHETDEN